MPLMESAKKVVEEFEFSADALNKGVKEFLQEMGEESPLSVNMKSRTDVPIQMMVLRNLALQWHRFLHT